MGTVNQSEVKIFMFGKRRKVAYFCYFKYTDKGEDEGGLPPRYKLNLQIFYIFLNKTKNFLN